MKKTKIIATSALVVGIIISILLYNKSKMAASSKNDILGTIPVSVTTVGKMQLTDAHSLAGTITANNDVAIVSETEGKVTAVLAKVGDYKTAGSTLLQVDDELKRAAYSTAEVNYEKAKKDLERFESLHQQRAVTDQQYETARFTFKSAEAQYIVARKQYNDTKITTPISGIVSARLVDVGTMIQTKMAVANVVDISRLKVKLNVAERDVFHLTVGNHVDVTTDIYPGVIFAGKIETISSKSDEAHTYPVEVSLSNSKEHPLKAGMFARVAFQTSNHNDVVAIPREALVGSFKKPQVFVVKDGIAKIRDLVIDAAIGANVEVLSGVREGESIVINGQNNLKDNVSVTIVK
jgi:RND family efflux transporter MFP subunit